MQKEKKKILINKLLSELKEIFVCEQPKNPFGVMFKEDINTIEAKMINDFFLKQSPIGLSIELLKEIEDYPTFALNWMNFNSFKFYLPIYMRLALENDRELDFIFFVLVALTPKNNEFTNINLFYDSLSLNQHNFIKDFIRFLASDLFFELNEGWEITKDIRSIKTQALKAYFGLTNTNMIVTTSMFNFTEAH